MKLQTKIRLGMSFLLALLLLTGGSAIFLLCDSGQDASAMEAIVALCLMLAGTFALNFPVIITSPIRQIADDIREIANGRVEHRVVSETRDEFGDIANAVNQLATRLETYTHPRPPKPPLAALKRHAVQLEKQMHNRLSAEQLMLVSQIKADCQRLLQMAENAPDKQI